MVKTTDLNDDGANPAHEGAPGRFDRMAILFVVIVALTGGIVWYLLSRDTLVPPEQAEKLILQQLVGDEETARILKENRKASPDDPSGKSPGIPQTIGLSTRRTIWPLISVTVSGKAYAVLITTPARSEKGDVTDENRYTYQLGVYGEAESLKIIKRNTGVAVQLKRFDGIYTHDIHIRGYEFKNTANPSVITAGGTADIGSIEKIAEWKLVPN